MLGKVRDLFKSSTRNIQIKEDVLGSSYCLISNFSKYLQIVKCAQISGSIQKSNIGMAKTGLKWADHWWKKHEK